MRWSPANFFGNFCFPCSCAELLGIDTAGLLDDVAPTDDVPLDDLEHAVGAAVLLLRDGAADRGKSRPIAPQAQVTTLSCALTLQRRRPTFSREKVGRRRRGRPGLHAVLAKQMPGLFLGVAGCPSQSPGNLGSYKHRLWAPRRISMFGPTRARPHQEPIVERLDQVPLLRTQGLPRCPIAGDHDLVTA